MSHPNCWFARSLSEFTGFSRTLCGGAWARNTFDSLRCVLYYQDSVRVLTDVLAAARRAPPVALLPRAVSKPTRCNVQADTHDSEGTHTTV